MRIEVKQIKKAFGKKKVLEGVDLTADSGECIGVIGANGCGKSTLIAVLAGVQRADGGAFLCDGHDLLKSAADRSRLVGYVPQGTPLFEELTAFDNLLLWYDKKSLQQELAEGVLKTLGIGDFLKVRVSKMSGGMKKRLSIGCALASHPPVLLLDEPMSALDIVCKTAIQRYLREYKRAGGILILITHDVLELELCDRCFLLKDGVARPIAFTGNTEELAEMLG